MIPRGRLDIGSWLLWISLGRLLLPRVDRTAIAKSLAAAMPDPRETLAFLSVRSGLEAVLTALNWPRGTEILMSAVTIPDMANILRHHGLTPVPLDVDPATLAPATAQARERVTPRTRALLIAPLFGSRLDMRDMAEFARQHGLLLWEDLAQGFAADGRFGDPLADISFLSFGTIKAQTALGGALLRFRDPDLAARCHGIQRQWPIDSSWRFFRKIVLALMMSVLGRPTVFALLVLTARCLGKDPDDAITGSVRGFPGKELFQALRHQPSRPLLDLLHRRITRPDRSGILRKTALAEEYRRQLPPSVLLGSQACFPAHWVLPIRSRDPLRLCATLRASGFDATVRASQLRVISESPAEARRQAPSASAWVPQMLFLPLHPALRSSHIEKMAALVREFEFAPQAGAEASAGRSVHDL